MAADVARLFLDVVREQMSANLARMQEGRGTAIATPCGTGADGGEPERRCTAVLRAEYY